jgi:hypothetical protein
VQTGKLRLRPWISGSNTLLVVAKRIKAVFFADLAECDSDDVANESALELCVLLLMFIVLLCLCLLHTLHACCCSWKTDAAAFEDEVRVCVQHSCKSATLFSVEGS